MRTRLIELDITLPDSLAERVREYAQKVDMTVDQFIISAIAEMLSALMTDEYLEERGRRGSQEKFLAVLAKAPDVLPEPGDES